MSWQRKFLCNLDGVTFYTYPDNWDSNLEYFLQRDNYIWVCKDHHIEITKMLRLFNDYMYAISDWQPKHMLPFPMMTNLQYKDYTYTIGPSDLTLHIADDKNTIIFNCNLRGWDKAVIRHLTQEEYNQHMFDEIMGTLLAYERGIAE